MATDPFIVAVFFGFVPAMGFLYILLREYHAFFSEKRIFRVFLLGMLIGTLITFLEQGLRPQLASSASAGWDLASLGALAGYCVLLGLLESMALTAFLNWKTFRMRRDTPFYGTAFGLGFGATHALFLMLLVVRVVQDSPGATGLDVVSQAIILAVIGVFFTAHILAHAAMATWVAQGSATGNLKPWILRATLVGSVYSALFYGVLLVREPPIVSYALSGAALALGMVLVTRIIDRLDRIVPPEILREMGIHNRRIARKVLRDEPAREP